MNKRLQFSTVIHGYGMSDIPDEIAGRTLVDFRASSGWSACGHADLADWQLYVFYLQNINVASFSLLWYFH